MTPIFWPLRMTPILWPQRMTPIFWHQRMTPIFWPQRMTPIFWSLRMTPIFWPQRMTPIPDKFLSKYAMALDNVRCTSLNSCCFTKGYGNYAVCTRSILQQSLSEQDFKECFENFTESGGVLEKLRCLDLRYFSPRQVANLMCFPADFSFPDHLTNRQCYMALGNSLNVRVVSF